MNSIINGVVDFLYNILFFVIDLLPDSPFSTLSLVISDEIKVYLGYMNYFIPVNFFIAVLEIWLSAVVVYYIYILILRWIKLIN
ncbi:MAG: hypothetical protein R3Y12_07885 [Clostridia bacterium]